MRNTSNSVTRPGRRTLSALLLVGFLAHAGDGLVALMCNPGMDHGPHGIAIWAFHPEPDHVGDDPHRGHLPKGPQHESHHGHEPESPVGPDIGRTADGEPTGTHRHPDHGDDPCPMGSDVMAFCGGVATVPTPAPTAGPGAYFGDGAALAAAADIHGTLLSLKLFRPPRA